MTFDYSYWGPIIIIAALFVYGVYVLIKTLRYYLKVKALRDKNLAENKEHYTKNSDSLIWGCLYGLLAIAGVAGTIYGFTISDLVTITAFGFICVYALSLVFEVTLKRTIYFGETHFIFDKYFMKYRSIRDVKETGKLVKTYEAYNNVEAEPIKLPRKYGILLEEQVNKFKETHKRSLRR